jgi:toxin ParE1/3/4
MRPRPIFYAAARQDLHDIATWIGRDNPEAARRVLRRILQTIESLQSLPRLSRPGRARGALERLVPRTPYVVVFRLQPHLETVVVMAIVHAARSR